MRKQVLLISLGLLIAVLAVYAASWAAVESFDSYSISDDLDTKSGGSGWGGNWVCNTAAYIVDTAPSGGQGGLAIKEEQTTLKTATRNLPASISAGSFRFRSRVSGTPNGVLQIMARESGSAEIDIRFNGAGNIVRIYGSGGTSETLVSGFSLNTWYIFDVEFDDVAQPDKYRVSVDGGAFTAWQLVRTEAYTAMSDFRFSDDSTNAFTWWNDDIRVTPTQSVVPVLKRYYDLLRSGLLDEGRNLEIARAQ